MRSARTRTAAVLVSLWLAVALAARADAASLYKCSDGEGRLSYQSAPCPPGAAVVWERAVSAEAAPPAARDASADTDAFAATAKGAGKPSSRNATPPVRRSSGAPRASPPRPSASRACQSAKAADAAYRAQPLSRVTHDGLRRHGDRIRQACGPG